MLNAKLRRPVNKIIISKLLIFILIKIIILAKENIKIVCIMNKLMPGLLSLFLVFISTMAFAIHPNKVVDTKQTEEISPLDLSVDKSIDDLSKDERRRAKLEKRFQKFEKKINKKLKRSESQISSMWDDSRFKLGALLILGAIGLGILGALGILAGLFNFIAGLLALAGIILVIWALVDY